MSLTADNESFSSTDDAFRGLLREQYAVETEVGIKAGLRLVRGNELVVTSLSYGSWPRHVQDNCVHEWEQDDED